MRVLVIGAGVIGGYLAHVLHCAGNEVALLARGSWRENLEQNGLVIRHALQRKQTVDRLRVVGEVDERHYDAVFAVMQHQQMWRVLDDLAQVDAPLVVLVGNNLSAPEMDAEIRACEASPRTVLFGFQGTAGRREDGRIVSIHLGGGSMTLGGLRAEPEEEVKDKIASLFAGTNYRLTWMRDMDAWYRCHLALVLPACYLCYATGCDLRRATRRQRRLLLDAADEGCRLLRALGTPILPEGDDAFYAPGPKRLLMAAMMFVMAKTVVGDLAASDHCRHAVTEMEGLDAAWARLRRQRPELSMPAWDELRAAMPNWTELHRIYERG